MSHSIRWLIVLSSLVCSAGSCSRAPLLEPGLAGTRVLFIGNSLTYFNDLPATVAAIAASAGDTMSVAMAAGPDLAIIDHLNGASNAVALLRSQRWDYVVLQQGPSTTPVNRDSLTLWTTMINPHIRSAGAQAALFMVWPALAQWERLDLVRQSYDQAARAVGGMLLPAGEAWRIARAADASIAVYGPDGYHPSQLGTFLAALTIYGRLSGRDVRALPARAFADGREIALDAATIRRLQEAAHGANTR